MRAIYLVLIGAVLLGCGKDKEIVGGNPSTTNEFKTGKPEIGQAVSYKRSGKFLRFQYSNGSGPTNSVKCFYNDKESKVVVVDVDFDEDKITLLSSRKYENLLTNESHDECFKEFNSDWSSFFTRRISDYSNLYELHRRQVEKECVKGMTCSTSVEVVNGIVFFKASGFYKNRNKEVIKFESEMIPNFESPWLWESKKYSETGLNLTTQEVIKMDLPFKEFSTITVKDESELVNSALLGKVALSVTEAEEVQSPRKYKFKKVDGGIFTEEVNSIYVDRYGCPGKGYEYIVGAYKIDDEESIRANKYLNFVLDEKNTKKEYLQACRDKAQKEMAQPYIIFEFKLLTDNSLLINEFDGYKKFKLSKFEEKTKFVTNFLNGKSYSRKISTEWGGYDKVLPFKKTDLGLITEENDFSGVSVPSKQEGEYYTCPGKHRLYVKEIYQVGSESILIGDHYNEVLLNEGETEPDYLQNCREKAINESGKYYSYLWLEIVDDETLKVWEYNGIF